MEGHAVPCGESSLDATAVATLRAALPATIAIYRFGSSVDGMSRPGGASPKP